MTGSGGERAWLAGTALATGAVALALFGAARAQAPGVTPAQDGSPGAQVYAASCGACHNNGEQMRAPGLANLHVMPASQIRFALTEGVMRGVGATLSADQREAVTRWLAAPETPAATAAAQAEASGAPSRAPAPGRAGHGAATGLPNATAPAVATDWVQALRCGPDREAIDPAARRILTSAGVELNNARRMGAAQAGLTTAQLANLEVAWTLAFPQTTGLRVTPVIVGTTLFYAAPQPGVLLALDTRTGCVKWAQKSESPFRASPAYGLAGKRAALFVADARGMVRALDPATGDVIWKNDPRYDNTVPITGGLVLAGDKLIVPVSASDVGRAMDGKYGCCTTHGSVVAMDAATGKVLWTAHTMEAAKPLGRKNSAGVEMSGPSGAPIWNTPAVDLKRGIVYTGTGENTSPPNTKTSDAILALDLNTGKTLWSFQALERDIWNMSCRGPTASGPNCFFMAGEESVLKDYDFGAGPVLATGANGRPVVLAGQKSGHVWALDAGKQGAVLWSKRFGEGTALGGVHWGLASDGKRVFAPINDPGPLPPKGKAVPGLHALDIATGAELWSWSAQPDCEGERGGKVSGCALHAGLSAAPLVVDGALITGSLDGKVRIFDAASGRVLWTYDTIRDYPARTPGGVLGKGGSIDAQSIAAGDGMVFVGSGYGSFSQQAGNVLIAFRPKAGAARVASR